MKEGWIEKLPASLMLRLLPLIHQIDNSNYPQLFMLLESWCFKSDSNKATRCM